MATNDVKSTSHQIEEHKRVSFGGEKQIVYDDGIADDYTLNHQQHISKHNNAFTDTNAPPNKVTVRSENFEVPRPISPPAQLNAVAAADTPLISISPVLPSFIKKMENESSENPFRPQESLYHEVDPIVEAYRQRPFPPSPSGSPIPPTIAASPTANGFYSNKTTPARLTKREPELSETPKSHVNHSHYERTTIMTTKSAAADEASPNTSSTSVTVTKRNGNGGGVASRTASLAEARSPKANSDAQQPLISGKDAIPPPHKAEIVHVKEKKRKCCGCCCLQ